MKILVTGATGFLGSHLIPLLLSQGHEVRGLGRSLPGPALQGAQFVRADLGDEAAVRQALEGMEVLYHLAGQVSFDPKDGQKMYALHVEATRSLLQAVDGSGVGRVVLASTSGTIAVSREERIATEEDPYPIEVVGRWPYYASKIFEEQMTLEHCRKRKLPLVILNPSLLLGPGDERLSSTWTVSRFLAGDIPSMPNGGMSFVDVRDAAAAFAAALTRGELYGRHLMGLNMPLSEFFGRLSRMTGVQTPSLRLPRALTLVGAHLLERWATVRGKKPALVPQEVEIGEHFFYFDSAKAERELGFCARDPHQTLHDTVGDLLSRMPEGSLPGRPGKLRQTRQNT